jgi:type IV secretion system protein VirD4
MTPTRFLVGQIFVVFAIVLGGLWFSTEWVTATLDYQPRLGLPWFEILSLPVYYQWRLFEWLYGFDAYAPTLLNNAGIIAASSDVAGIVVAVIGSQWRARQSRLATTYWSFRWASQSAGLFQPAGVFLGRLKDRYLRHDGPEDVMAFAPTRSGKRVGWVIPTLLSWTGSAVILSHFIECQRSAQRAAIITLEDYGERYSADTKRYSADTNSAGKIRRPLTRHTCC